MIKAHKIRLNPTPDQEPYFWRAAGVSRFTFNWTLGRYNELRASGQKPSINKLKKEFNAIKGERFPWVYEVSKTACEGAFMDLRAAFKNYFERQKAGTQTTQRRSTARLSPFQKQEESHALVLY